MVDQPDAYPIQFSVDYPDRALDRFSTFFRILFVIPISVVLMLVSAGVLALDDYGITAFLTKGFVGGSLVWAPLAMLLFRHKYPRWWFDWNVELLKFSSRVTAYGLLLRDEYPSTDEEQAVHLDIPYPNVKQELHPWLPLVKWILAIPHYIVLFFLSIAGLLAVIIAWFAILFTGRYPKGLHAFNVGLMRWGIRIVAYQTLLVTDQYPPFRLSP
jgi:hypothetical protein